MKASRWAGALALLPGAVAWAGPQVGTVTNVVGSVQLYSHPSATGFEGPSPHVKFQGVNYSVADAKAGDPLEQDNLLRTQPGGRARVIFENGDQIYVAPATSFHVSWDHDAAEAKPQIELAYGKGRFVIEKGGPRSHLTIRTKTATMGVRGTDFFVAVNDATGATETATLRGVVQVQAAQAAADAPPVLVEPGQAAEVTPPAPGAPPATIALQPITQVELRAIERTSTVPPPAQPPAPEVAGKLQALEAAATHITLTDIRAATPALAKHAENETSTDLNTAVVAQLAASAPQHAPHEAGGGTPPPTPIADETLEKTPAAPAEQPPASEPPTRRFGFTAVGALNLSSLAGSGGGVTGGLRPGGGGGLLFAYRMASHPFGLELGALVVARDTSAASATAFEFPLLARWWFWKGLSLGLGGYAVSQNAPAVLQNYDFGLEASLAYDYRLSPHWSAVADVRVLYGIYNVAVTGNSTYNDVQGLLGARFDLSAPGD